MNDVARDDEPETGGNRVGRWSRVQMSALGQKQTCAVQQPMSTLPLKAEHHNIRLRLETEHRDLLDLQRSREAALCSSVEICPFLALSDQGSDPDRHARLEAGRITL